MQAPDALPLVISTDDHVVEPRHLWQTWLPARHRDRGPRVLRDRVGGLTLRGGKVDYTIGDPDGVVADIWAFEDLRIPQFRTGAAVGFEPEEVSMTPMTFDEMRPGCYEPGARLADMDLNGVEASLCFPNVFVRFAGQTFSEAKDKELGVACIRAYNDWIVEEWAAPSCGRLLPLVIVPLWDPSLAAAEVQRNAARGVRAVCFSEIPPYLGLPSIHTRHWDPFLRACAETDSVIHMHIGSGSRFPSTSDDAPAGVGSTLTFMNAAMSLTDWLMSGVLERFPGLTLAFAECQIGWLPYVLERADDVWADSIGWNEVRGNLPRPPSSYFADHVFCSFFKDDHGIRSITEIGEGNVVFETDYPHADTTWPNTRAVVAEMATQLAPAVLEKVVRGNAQRVLRIDAG